MENKAYAAKVRELCREHPEYRADAYFFVADAVRFTVDRARRGGDAPRHVTGRELLDGFRELALGRFGPLTLDVVLDWGLLRSEDVGAVVFRMVEHGLLGANEQDSPEDFADGFDFETAFLSPFDASAPPGRAGSE